MRRDPERKTDGDKGRDDTIKQTEKEAIGRQREREGERQTDGSGEEADRNLLGQPARHSGERGKPEKCQRKREDEDREREGRAGQRGRILLQDSSDSLTTCSSLKTASSDVPPVMAQLREKSVRRKPRLHGNKRVHLVCSKCLF